MTTPKTAEELTKQIESLVADHLHHVRESARAALEQAFSAQPTVTMKKQAAATASDDSTLPRMQRRNATQLTELGEKLYAQICKQPGESMAVFAANLGVAAQELHHPMSKLRNDKRIRSAGQRNLTRYFPAVRPRTST